MTPSGQIGVVVNNSTVRRHPLSGPVSSSRINMSSQAVAGHHKKYSLYLVSEEAPDISQWPAFKHSGGRRKGEGMGKKTQKNLKNSDRRKDSRNE